MTERKRRQTDGKRARNSAQATREDTNPAALQLPRASLNDGASSPESLFELQHAAGNVAVRKMLSGTNIGSVVVSRDPEDDNAEENVYTAEKRLENIHKKIELGIEWLHDRWKDGLQNFEGRVKFEADQMAETAILENLGKAIGEAVLDYALNAFPPPWNTIVSVTTDAGRGVLSDYEDEWKGGRQSQLVDFLNKTREGIQKSKEKMQNEFENTKEGVDKSYPGELSEKNPTAEREQWIARYEAAAESFQARIPKTAAFQQQITEKFADTGQMVGLVTQGTRHKSGTLTLGMKLKVSESGEVDPSSISTDTRWILHTSAPKAAGVADSLQESLDGFSPLFSTLPKKVLFDIDVDVPWYTGEALARCKLHVEGEFGKSRAYVEHDRSSDPEKDKRDREIANKIGHSPEVAKKMFEPTKIDV